MKNDNFNNAPSRSVTGGGSQTTPRAKELFSEAPAEAETETEAFSALQAVGPDPAAIRDHLEGIQNFAGISGVFNLSAEDHNGIGKESLVLVQIKDGS